MSSYKVIQDIEAEDKLVGPLTLRQFIYAGVSAVCLYICFLAYTKGASFLLVFFLPIAAVTGFFAFPWKGEQPTEIWALARLRFMIKPRVRIWNQSGIKDVVTITAPKRLEARRPLTNNLSENEVRSRLKALADTIDSRGWATRNASFSIYNQQRSQVVAPGQTPVAGVPTNDIFDDASTVSQNFDAMLNKSSQNQRQRVLSQMAAQTQQPQQPLQGQQGQSTLPPLPGQSIQPMQQMQPMQFQQMQQQAAVAVPSAQTVIRPQQYLQPQRGNMMPPQQFVQPTPMPSYQAPQLPAPVMPAQTTPGEPLFSAAHPPTPPPAQNSQPNAEPLQGMLQQSPALAAAPPAATPNGTPGSDYWFAGGGQANPSQINAAAGNTVDGGAATVSPAQSTALPEHYAAAISSGRIMADVPIATAVEPTDDEKAFAQLAKEQAKNQQVNYAHMRVLQPDGSGNTAATAVPSTPPSIPGMIDYGRPQPAEDQMQYDNSRPQSLQAADAASVSSQGSPNPQNQGGAQAVKPVTRTPDPAILNLANNDDLDVATLARRASKEIGKGSDEVEIRLH